ncbi:MAG: type II toxin-antitoxin system VapC family toxin [Rhizobiaceae bacterium]
MTSTLIDSNVLIDILGGADLPYRSWSLAALKDAAEEGEIVFSAVAWAEIAHPSLPEQTLLGSFARFTPQREDFPFAAAYPAGLAQRRYRLRGGGRDRTLPDFLIAAHALVAGHRLLTRDATRYRSYFPDLDIIAPDTHP